MLLKRRWRDSNARLVAVTPQPPVLLRRRWRCVDFAEREELTGPQALRPLSPTSRPPVRGRRTLAPLRVERGGASTPTSFPTKRPTVTRVTHRGARPALATCGPRSPGESCLAPRSGPCSVVKEKQGYSRRARGGDGPVRTEQTPRRVPELRRLTSWAPGSIGHVPRPAPCGFCRKSCRRCRGVGRGGRPHARPQRHFTGPGTKPRECWARGGARWPCPLSHSLFQGRFSLFSLEAEL